MQQIFYMQKVILIAGVMLSSMAYAQPRLIKQATVTTLTTVIAPENEEVQNVQGGGGNQMFRNFGDGETKSTTLLKDDKVKTIMKNDMGRSTIIRDNAAKLTTTLLEIMGNKTGFYITDDEQAEMKVKMDSMMAARRKADTANPGRPPVATDNPVEVSYTEGTKKIAGYECKKAYVITTRLLGIKDTVTVWYNPEFKLNNIASTGGTSSFGGFGNVGNFRSLNGLDKIDGFVMQYEMPMRRGRRMTVEVTKIDLAKEVADKEFEIPRDFEVKPMKEFQSMMQQGAGGMQFRMERQQ